MIDMLTRDDVLGVKGRLGSRDDVIGGQSGTRVQG